MTIELTNDPRVNAAMAYGMLKAVTSRAEEELCDDFKMFETEIAFIESVLSRIARGTQQVSKSAKVVSLAEFKAKKIRPEATRWEKGWGVVDKGSVPIKSKSGSDILFESEANAEKRAQLLNAA